MKAILSIVAFLVALGASYFSFEHKNKFTALRDSRIKNEETNVKQSAEADSEENILKTEKANFESVQTQKADAEATISTLQSDAGTLKKEAATLDGTIKEQEGEFAELEKALQAIKDTLNKSGMDAELSMEELGGKIEEITADKKAKEEKLDELNTLVEGANQSLSNARSEHDRLVKSNIARNATIARNAMSAVITAVNQDWGFVVIGAGSNSGFTPQTNLIVQRGGRAIGRVKPSSIEPTQTVAEIDEESLGEGVRLQPGDRVLLAKPKAN